MARADCKLERNMRIYKGYLRGVSYTYIAEIEGLSVSRVSQIIAFTKFQLDQNEPDYVNEFRRN